MEFDEVATQFCLIEAPTMRGGDLWFSDAMLGGIRRLAPDGKLETFLPERTHVGGMALNEDGRLICGGLGGLVWFDPDTGATGPLLSQVEGVPLMGVNDVCPDGKGGLYFGTHGSAGDFENGLKPANLGHLAADGTARIIDRGVTFCNGIGLSPDGKTLYHNESTNAVFAYDVAPDGSLASKRKFIDRHDPDGLAMDAAGGIWLAHYDSAEIARYLPDGTLDRRAALPHRNVINLCFGGKDMRDIYVTTAGDEGVDALLRGELAPREASVFKGRCDIAGQPVPLTRFALPPE